MDIVKVCKKHGNLTIDEVQRDKSRGKPCFRCAYCRRAQAKKYGDAHRQIYTERAKQWKFANKERFKEMQKKSRTKPGSTDKDWYFRELLYKNGFATKDITKELVDLKRVVVQINRKKKSNHEV
jgi:hypothetical protein